MHLYTYLPVLHPHSIYLMPMHSPMCYPPPPSLGTHLPCDYSLTHTLIALPSTHSHADSYTTLHAAALCEKPLAPAHPWHSTSLWALDVTLWELCQPRGRVSRHLLWFHLRFHGRHELSSWAPVCESPSACCHPDGPTAGRPPACSSPSLASGLGTSTGVRRERVDWFEAGSEGLAIASHGGCFGSQAAEMRLE